MSTQRKVLGSTGGFSRRDAIRLAGAGGAAALLASCGSDDSDGDPVAGNTPEDTSDTPAPAGLPTDDVSLRWMAGPDAGPFFEGWFERYRGEHPNIAATFDGVPFGELRDVVSLGVQNGNAHDVFASPPGIGYGQMVSEGWVAPLDDFIPNIEEWKARFRPGALSSSVYDGKVYSCPVTIDTGVQTMLLFNSAYLNDAGYDPETEPLSWEDFRDAAQKITQAGDGDYYGLVIGAGQPNLLTRYVVELASRASSGTTVYQGASFNWLTGEFQLTDDAHLGAIELLLAMVDDGSLLPGFNGMNGEQAAEAVPQGAAGMTLRQPNFASLWTKNHPDFDFGVGHPLAPDQASAVPVGATPGGALMFWAYADSPNLAVVGDLFSYLGSPEGSQEYFSHLGIANRPAFDGVFEEIDFSEVERRAVDLQDEVFRTRPDPQVRNSDVSTAMTEWQGPSTPDLGTSMQGILAGELDAGEGLQQLEDALNAELDRAIAAAQDKGLEVSREDWVFPNWDPMSHYAEEDYTEL